MEIPEFLDPDADDFRSRLIDLHDIKEHLDMLLFAAYASTIDRFFTQHPKAQAIHLSNTSDPSDNGRHAQVVEIDGEVDGDIDMEDLMDQLTEQINVLRDRGIYDALDEMFDTQNPTRIGRDDVMGQFGKFWAQAEGTRAGNAWNAMLAAAKAAKLDAGTGPAPAGHAGPRM